MCETFVSVVFMLFGLLSAVFSTMQYIPYIASILRGKTQPERAGWLIWFVLSLVMFVAQLAKGGSDSLWIVAVHIVGNGLVFLLSFKFGVGGFVKRDYLTLAAASVGLVLWVLTNEPAIALLIAIAVDAMGAALITIKAYQQPHNEPLITWVLGAAAGACSILAVAQPNSILIVYPIYAFLNSAVLAAVVILRKYRFSFTITRLQPATDSIPIEAD